MVLSKLSGARRNLYPQIHSLSTFLKFGLTPTPHHFNNFLVFLAQKSKFQSLLNLFSQINSNYSIGDSFTHSIKTPISPPHLWDLLISRICVNQRDPETALSLLRHCLTIGGSISPPYFAYFSVIHAFSSNGNMHSAIEVLEIMVKTHDNFFNNFVCSSVISGFVKVGEFEVAIEFFENAVKLYDLCPNIVTYTALFDAYYKLGRFDELVSNVDRDGLEFDVVFYSCWMYECFREGFIGEALQKHKQLVKRKIDMDIIGYTVIIDGLCKQGMVEKAVGILGKMEKEGLRPNTVTYTTLIMEFCRKGKLMEAFHLFKLVRNSELGMDENIYAVLIDGFCRSGYCSYSFHLLSDMEKRGIHPGIVTYNTLINGLCNAGRTSEADEVSKRVHGDIITYSTILQGYIKEQNIEGMLETRRRLEEAGVPFDPIMCNILIKALFMVGLYEDALAMYKTMPEMNLPVDSDTYCILVDGYCKVGRLDEALEVFDELRKTSISPVACYNSIIHGLCRMGMTDMAIEVFIEFCKRGLPFEGGMLMILLQAIFQVKSAEGILNLIRKTDILEPEIFDIVCNDAISYLYKRGFPEAASDVYLVMSRKGSNVTNSSYYCVLKALINHGRYLDAYNLVMGSENNLLLIDVVDYTIVVDGLCKEGHISKALDICYLVKKKGTALNIITYNTVINGLCRQGCHVQAFRLFDSLEKVNMVPSEITYATLINALSKEGYLLDARKLFERMVVKGYKPDTRVYNSLIIGHCRFGQMGEALNLLSDMEVKCLKPDEFTITALINCCYHVGDMEKALKLFFEFKRKGVLPDFLGFLFLVRGLCSKGRMEESRSIIREMLQTRSVIDLLNAVQTNFQTESIEDFLTSMCEQGRIREAITILNEVGLMFFPLGTLGPHSERKSFTSQSLISTDENALEFERCSEVEMEKVIKDHHCLGKRSRRRDFHSYYAVIALLCSRGKLDKANKLAKMLCGSEEVLS